MTLALIMVWFSHEPLVKVYTSHLWSSINWLYCFFLRWNITHAIVKSVCLFLFEFHSTDMNVREVFLYLRPNDVPVYILRSIHAWGLCCIFSAQGTRSFYHNCIYSVVQPGDRLFCRPSFKHTLRLTLLFRDIFYNIPRSSFFYESQLLPPDCVQGIVGRRTQT
jgi:hypothetical protein